MTPETEVVSCPACRHLVRIPADWLGQSVQCPECKARFTAPLRDGERLTNPVLIDPPQPDAKPLEARPDCMLWLPAFGLMLLGAVSLVLNCSTLHSMIADREGFETEKKAQAVEMAKMLGQDPNAVEGEANWTRLIGLAIWGVTCAAGSLAGGLAIALRRGFWLARIGSVLAILNVPAFCCVPGAIVGGWAFAMLRRDEGRAHFMR
jgi:hypothetical protein